MAKWLRSVTADSKPTAVAICSIAIGVAVPLKHLAGVPTATSIMGPLHGAMFLIYLGVVVDTTWGGQWTTREIARFLIAALIPFGSFANLRWLNRKKAALTG